MARISFNLAAKCDKAGRSQNQDNYWVCPDLSRINDSFDDVINKDKDVTLSEKGALLVVADGMGGMNAGEKASELVIKGVQKGFSKIPEGILGNDDQMLSFIRDVIVSSDQSVKDYAKSNREADGLGSTIVLLWLWGEKAYCGWCGDSRIYRYNPNNSLVRLSHDHSYVQELVDEGKIEPEEAFDHPDGNIVTRALGDNGEKANPELKVYDICERDVFLLCSDGLCGLLQDNQIEDIISVNCSSTKDALAALWKAGETEGWTDNATIDLLNIVEGGMRPKGVAVGYPIIRKKVELKQQDTGYKNTSGKEEQQPDGGIGRFFKPPFLYIYAVVAIVLLGLILFKTCSSNEDTSGQSNSNVFTDEVPISVGQNGTTTNHQGNEPQEPNKPQRPSKPGGRTNNANTQGSSGGTNNPNPLPGNSNSDNNNNQLNANQQSSSEEMSSSRRPSKDYYDMYNKMVNGEYGRISDLWRQIRHREGNYITAEESRILNEYSTNVNNLINNEQFNKLEPDKQNVIINQLLGLSKKIESERRSYRVVDSYHPNRSTGVIRLNRNSPSLLD